MKKDNQRTTNHPKTSAAAQPSKLNQMIYDRALKGFPYPPLVATGGYSYYEVEDKTLVSSLEYTFSAEKLASELLGPQKLLPGETIEGWLLTDLWNDDGEIRIDGRGNMARNGDWEKGMLLDEDCRMLYFDYDIETREWCFWISR